MDRPDPVPSATMVHGPRFCQWRRRRFRRPARNDLLIDAFPERLHHPKEDEFLFARLAKRDANAKGLIDALKAEHVAGAKMVRDLERALNEYESIWPRGADKFADAVAPVGLGDRWKRTPAGVTSPPAP